MRHDKPWLVPGFMFIHPELLRYYQLLETVSYKVRFIGSAKGTLTCQ